MEAPSWLRLWLVPWKMRAMNLIPQTGKAKRVLSSIISAVEFFLHFKKYEHLEDQDCVLVMFNLLQR